MKDWWSCFTSESFSEAGSYGCHRSVEKVMAYVDSIKPLISERGVENSLSSNDQYVKDVCTPLEQSICSINTWACGTGKLFSPYKRSVTSPTGPFFSSIPWISQIFRLTSGTVSTQSHAQESPSAEWQCTLFLNASGFTKRDIRFHVWENLILNSQVIRATPCRWPSIFPTFRKTVMYSSLWRNESSLLTTVPGSWFALCECNTRINTANCVSGYSQHGV